MCPFAEMWWCWANTYTLVYRYRYVNSLAYFTLDLFFVAKTLVRLQAAETQLPLYIHLPSYPNRDFPGVSDFCFSEI